MRRPPLLAFGGLAVATVAAFFLIQHLKVGTPFLTSDPGPFPGQINPRDGGSCVVKAAGGKLVADSGTSITFWLLHESDYASVYVVGPDGQNVATLASGVYMPAVPFPHFATRTFTWNGHVYGGGLAPAGSYYMKVFLRRQDRTIDITTTDGTLEPVRVDYASRCPGAMKG